MIALKKYNKQSGAILVFFAVLLPVIMGFVGLAVDVGYVFWEKERLQNVVDASGFASDEYIDDNAVFLSTVKNHLESNGLNIEKIIESNAPIEPNKIGASTLSWSFNNNKDEVRLIITKKVSVFFINVLTDAFKDGIDISVDTTIKKSQENDFRIVAKDGLYINFTSVANSNKDNVDAGNWLKGNVYAKELLRISYGILGNSEKHQRNLLAVNGNIYTNQLATDLPDMEKANINKIEFYGERLAQKKGTTIKNGKEAIKPTSQDGAESRILELENKYEEKLKDTTSSIINAGNGVIEIIKGSDEDLVIKGSGVAIIKTDNAKFKNIYSEANIIIEGEKNIFDGVIYSRKNIVVTYSADGKGYNHGNGNGSIATEYTTQIFGKRCMLFGKNILFGYNYDLSEMDDYDKPTNLKTNKDKKVSSDWWVNFFKKAPDVEKQNILDYGSGAVDGNYSTQSAIIYYGDGGVNGIPERWPSLKNDSSGKSLAYHIFQ